MLKKAATKQTREKFMKLNLYSAIGFSILLALSIIFKNQLNTNTEVNLCLGGISIASIGNTMVSYIQKKRLEKE